MKIFRTIKLSQKLTEEPAGDVEDFQHPEQQNAGLSEMAFYTYRRHMDQIQVDKDTVWPLGEGRNMHGYYCGPGPIRDKSCQKLADNKPLPPPKDELDCACMEHDFDYCKAGIGWKQAYGKFISPEAAGPDAKLIRTVRELMKKMNWYQRTKAMMVLGYFQFRQRLPKADREGNPLHPQKWREQAEAFTTRQAQRLPYGGNEKPCISCSRANGKRQGEPS